jgi:two-component sensor histidine kinase
LLRSGRSLYSALGTVDRETFKRFVEELQVNRATIGVRAVGWSVALNGNDVAALENEVRRQDIPDFRVWPKAAGSSSKTHIILYLEPMNEQNKKALGYNMYSDPTRRRAMQKAARWGLAVASETVVLVQDRKQPKLGFLVYVPVYKGDVSKSTPDAREAQLQGFVYSAIRVSDFVNTAQIESKQLGAKVSIYDAVSGPQKLLYQKSASMRGDYFAKQNVQIANRKWQLVLAAERSSFLSPLAALILVFGIALSLLLGALTALILMGGRNAQKMLLAQQEYETVRNVLTRELTHRVKNTLATVTSLAMLTRRGAASVDAYADALTSRLRALSATHDLLTHRDWLNAPLRAVLEAELAPFSNAGDVRLNLSGPDVALSPNIALSLGLAIHELVTNAAKYGAFSVKDGVISIDWTILDNRDAVRLVWKESNGPAVKKPKTRGFGSDLVEKLMARELNTEVKIDFQADGVRCTLIIPILRPG